VNGTRTARKGFTLLEVILALALATAVMAVLTSTVTVQLRLYQRGGAAVEEARLARALLRRIADDLCAAVPDPAAAEGVGTLVGTRDELQVTIRQALPPSRVATAAAAASLPPERLNDLWIVNYRLADGGGGLVRCERDYATAAWAAVHGEADAWRAAAAVVAPEVEALELVYYQDAAAQEQWDSGQQGRLPSAVRISLSLRRSQRAGSPLRDTAADGPRTSPVYSLLVSLPGPAPPAAQPEPEEEDAPSDSGEASNE
jgi:prepilin-type N-terminal cleavage/methylation domain-containing protein